jgi:hypothetical protein
METEVQEVKLYGRIKFAFKAFFSVLFLRPVVVFYDDEQMYARSNFMLLARMTATMYQLCETIADSEDGMIVNLDSLSYGEERKN